MVAFIVNDIQSLKPAQTTTRLIEAAITAGERVAVTDIRSMGARAPSDLFAMAVVLEASNETTRVQICRATSMRKRKPINLADHSLVMIRTSPGRDIANSWAHRFTLELCQLASERSINVVNDPVALRRASSKLYGACLPRDLTPATLVTVSFQQVRDFLAELGKPAVIKPLLGSQGRDVFFVDGPDQTNLRQVCELLGRTGYLLVQEFLPEAARGDYRVIVFDGDILTVDGVDCVVHRVPRGDEFRANVALGARANPGELDRDQLHTARRVAKIIYKDGLRLAGLDLVGSQLVEVNAYSTGGIVDAEKFYERDFAGPIVSKLLGCGSIGTP